MSIRQLFGFLIGGLFILLIVTIYNKRVINTTVLLQAGHEGRTKGNIGSINGKYREVEWNTLVTKAIEKELEKENIEVTRVGAKIPIANTRLALSIHFDGAKRPCSTGASIGYDRDHLYAKEVGQRWKDIYKEYFPFKWHRDNFTR
ncbi:MAG: N-acetylmuramoyl-L-alanine amidase, partial [Epsilonproteobacteria bacterium]|nr:N-acetylmuramoyl-L-alanine amidase [Campylobacterota bacterium]